MSEDAHPIPLGEALVVCLTCGYRYDDKTPAGRCPREGLHPDPAEIPRAWTVIGVSASDDEPVVLTVIEGDPELHDVETDHDWWSEVVLASTPAEAVRFAVGVRRDMLGLV